MSTERNKDLVRRFYEEIFNKGNLAGLGEFVSTDFVDHNPEPGQRPGLEGLKEAFTVFFGAFGGFHVDVEDMIAEDDKVAVRLTMQATHKGDFAGLAATGKRVSVTLIDILRIANGKMAERWGLYDLPGMMHQLGVTVGT